MALTNTELKWATVMVLTAPIRRGLFPARIKIVVPPDKLIYQNNEIVNLTGIKVVAFCADGSPWGEIPLSELQCEPTLIQRNSAYGYESDFDTGDFGQPIPTFYHPRDILLYQYTQTNVPIEHAATVKPVPLNPGLVVTESSPDVLSFFGVSTDRGTVIANLHEVVVDLRTGDIVEEISQSFETVQSYIAYDKQVWYCRCVIAHKGAKKDVIIGPTDWFYGAIDSEYVGPAAWTLLYGIARVRITVGWPRPGDGRLLTDSFDVTVS